MLDTQIIQVLTDWWPVFGRLLAVQDVLSPVPALEF